MAHRSSKDPDHEPRSGYRLPNVIVEERAAGVIVLAVLAAAASSFGIVRGCELEREQRLREGLERDPSPLPDQPAARGGRDGKSTP